MIPTGGAAWSHLAEPAILLVVMDQAAEACQHQRRQAARHDRQQIAQLDDPIAPPQPDKERLQRAERDQRKERPISPGLLLAAKHGGQQGQQQDGDDERQRNEDQGDSLEAAFNLRMMARIAIEGDLNRD